jgi:heavy metal sensor kinase
MKLAPRNVESRLTIWYVSVLGALLAAYGAGSLFYLFLSMRDQLDHNLREDVETVEGLLTHEPGGSVSLRSPHDNEEELPSQRFVEVWSPEGALLYRSPELRGQALDGPPSSKEGIETTMPRSKRLGDGLWVRMASSGPRIDGRPIVLRVAHSEEPVWRELGEFTWVLALGFAPGIVLAALGGYALARKALAPIDAMRQKAQEISAENLSERLVVENPDDELGKLASVFNAMLERLHAAFEQLRRFTADASHELRTPLTAIRSVGEVALQDQRTPAEYRDVIGNMLEEVDRLTRLVKSLLVLSRADARHVHLQLTNISLLALAREASAVVEVLAEEKGQRIEIEGGDPHLLIHADRLILRQAVVNLLDNSIKYSPENTRILVKIAAEPAGQVSLQITDQGPGIPPEHQAHVFDRFYRLDKARTREWGGAGLGLSITRWAVDAHGGKISLPSDEGQGATFRIYLPLAMSSSVSDPVASQ